MLHQKVIICEKLTVISFQGFKIHHKFSLLHLELIHIFVVQIPKSGLPDKQEEDYQ
jgi:hypothetical protein